MPSLTGLLNDSTTKLKRQITVPQQEKEDKKLDNDSFSFTDSDLPSELRGGNNLDESSKESIISQAKQ